MEQKIKQVYKELGIFDISLMNHCRFCDSCWKGTSEEDKRNSDWRIYLPYIGKKYELAKVLFVGINMNDYGSADAASNLAKWAIEQVVSGKKRTFANPKKKYIGSLLWHRIFTYSVLLLRETNVLTKPVKKKLPSIAEMKEAYEFIAMTNSIKCSPIKARSKPTNEMWLNCPNFIFKEELKILKPKYLIVLGLENYQNIKQLFTINSTNSEGQVSLVKAQLESKDLNIIVIPHPSSSQGTAIQRQYELEILLESFPENKVCV